MEKKILIAVPVCDNRGFILDSMSQLEDLSVSYQEKGDDSVGEIIVIDDGSNDGTGELAAEHPWMRYIRFENSMGHGRAIINALQYAGDMDYDYLITIGPGAKRFMEDVKLIVQNLEYGYDIVSCSRILENYDHGKVPPGDIEVTQAVSSALKEISAFDITDPLSGIKGYALDSLKSFELTDYTHGVYLQLWIQAYYFGLNILELPSQSDSLLGEELRQYEEPEVLFLSIMETEKYLYNRGEVN